MESTQCMDRSRSSSCMCTYITSFIAIGYAVRSQMAEVTVEALSESVDAISSALQQR